MASGYVHVYSTMHYIAVGQPICAGDSPPGTRGYVCKHSLLLEAVLYFRQLTQSTLSLRSAHDIVLGAVGLPAVDTVKVQLHRKPGY